MPDLIPRKAYHSFLARVLAQLSNRVTAHYFLVGDLSQRVVDVDIIRQMIACIEALNYKCLRYLRQELGQFQVLVGPNASGKSTFLDVIAFIRDLLFAGPDDAVANRASNSRRLRELVWQGIGNRFELSVEMRIPEHLREKQDAKLPLMCRYEVAIGNSEDDPDPRILVEALLLLREPAPRPNGQRDMFPVEPKAPETILLSTKQSKARWKTVVKKTEDPGNDYFGSETTGWRTQFRLGPTKSALANLPEDEQKFPVATWAKTFLMGGIESLALESRSIRVPSPRDRGLSLRFDGSNLASVVKRLQHNQERFQAWIQHIQTALPDLETVRVNERRQDRTIYLTLVYKHNLRVPSWLVSDGTLRLLALTVLAYIEPGDATDLIEEPENGIHPQAVQAVFQSLSSAYRTQVLVATHSPVFLRLAKPEQVLCFSKTPGGATDVVNGSEHPKLRNWQGEVSLADFFAAGVLG